MHAAFDGTNLHRRIRPTTTRKMRKYIVALVPDPGVPTTSLVRKGWGIDHWTTIPLSTKVLGRAERHPWSEHQYAATGGTRPSRKSATHPGNRTLIYPSEKVDDIDERTPKHVRNGSTGPLSWETTSSPPNLEYKHVYLLLTSEKPKLTSTSNPPERAPLGPILVPTSEKLPLPT